MKRIYFILPILLLVFTQTFSQKNPPKVENPIFVFNNAFNTRGTSYSDIASLLSKLGYDGIEHREVKGIFDLNKELKKKNLKIFADYVRIDIDNEQPYLAEWKETIPKLAGTGLILWVHIHSKKYKPSDTAADKLIVPIIQELADIAKPYGVKIAIYPHNNFLVESAEHSASLAKQANRENVGAVFNLVHFLWNKREKSLEATIKDVAPYLFAASISGAGTTDSPNGREKILPVGEGSYDVYKVVKSLLDNGFKGPIGIQCYSVKGEPADFLKTSMDAWKSYVNLYENGVNTLSEKEVEEGWKLLFDGFTADGWRGITKKTFPEKGWEIMDGEIRVDATDGAESDNGGDILTTVPYGPDFELTWEWQMNTVGGNSGLKYFVQEENTINGPYGPGYGYGLEYQILDDPNHPWMKEGKMTPNDYHTVGSLYEFFPASPDKKVKPLGEWNVSRIVSKNNKVQHWLNGAKILEYERGGKKFRKMLKKSKFKDVKEFGQQETGHLLLQDHGSKVAYRNIKIRTL